MEQGQDSLRITAEHFSEPFAFSIARTLGFKEIAGGLEHELNRYGHSYTDLLNSSAKDSTLAAKYNPELVVDLLLDTRMETLTLLEQYQNQYSEFIDNIEDHSQGIAGARSEISSIINNAAIAMADESTAKPRRSSGGDGFDPIKRPISPAKPYEGEGTVTRTNELPSHIKDTKPV
jgi:hypothetical protein